MSYGNDQFDNIHNEFLSFSINPEDIKPIPKIDTRYSLNIPTQITPQKIVKKLQKKDKKPQRNYTTEDLKITSGGPTITASDNFIDLYFDKILIILLIILVLVLITFNHKLYKNNEMILELLKEIVSKKA